MLKLLLVLTTLIISFSGHSKVDPFNTYRWNRKNVLRNSSKVSKTPWYEWWYYKIVLPETNESFFFVYGVVNPWDKKGELKGTRAYVEMGDFNSKTTFQAKVPVEQFNASYNETSVKVGTIATATDKHIKGSIDEHGKKVSWDIAVKHDWRFNATSWATGKNFTNIEWYPAQASAYCSGTIESEGKLYEFKDAPCYQDRNWGTSFPKWWTWIVSNNFVGHKDTTLAIGGGSPKYFRGEYDLMDGVTIGLKHKGVEYAWRPNEFAKIKMNISFGTWEVEATKGGYKIVLSATAPRENFMNLEFMTPTGEIFHDYEALIGDLTLKLYERHLPFRWKWKLIDTLISHHTGIEFGSKDVYEFESLFGEDKILFDSEAGQR